MHEIIELKFNGPPTNKQFEPWLYWPFKLRQNLQQPHLQLFKIAHPLNCKLGRETVQENIALFKGQEIKLKRVN
jgi:hypothetical protein